MRTAPLSMKLYGTKNVMAKCPFLSLKKDPGCFVRLALCLLAAWLQEGEKEA